MEEIKAGFSHEIEERVSVDKSAVSQGSGYSTHSMIAFTEGVQKYLLENETTVGGAIDIKHLKPTSIGEKVVCKSEVTKVSGKRIDFEVEVYKGSELVGAGKHIRFIINRSHFMEKLKS